MTHVRVCVECGEEYRPEIAQCADCGGELEDRHLGDDEPGFAAEPELPEWRPTPPPPDHRAVFHTNQTRDIAPLAEKLAEAEVTFHLHPEREGSGVRFGLYVAEADAAAALRAIASVVDAEAEATRIEAIERGFDPAKGYGNCPACETRLAAGSLECPECGLAMGAPVTTCPECGGDLDSAGACPRCESAL